MLALGRGALPSNLTEEYFAMSLKGEESYQTAKGRPHRLRAGARVSKIRVGAKVGIRGRANRFTRKARLLLLALLVACAAPRCSSCRRHSCAARTVVEAASPASGTISPTGPVLTFTGTWARHGHRHRLRRRRGDLRRGRQLRHLPPDGRARRLHGQGHRRQDSMDGRGQRLRPLHPQVPDAGLDRRAV
jgi:hypothetical protein